MPGIIDFPQIIQETVDQFSDLFPNEPQRRHLGEYLTGLLVADRKTISGIHREFAHTTDPSCLNRFLTAADWDTDRVQSTPPRLASAGSDDALS